MRLLLTMDYSELSSFEGSEGQPVFDYQLDMVNLNGSFTISSGHTLATVIAERLQNWAKFTNEEKWLEDALEYQRKYGNPVSGVAGLLEDIDTEKQQQKRDIPPTTTI